MLGVSMAAAMCNAGNMTPSVCRMLKGQDDLASMDMFVVQLSKAKALLGSNVLLSWKQCSMCIIHVFSRIPTLALTSIKPRCGDDAVMLCKEMTQDWK